MKLPEDPIVLALVGLALSLLGGAMSLVNILQGPL